MSETGSVLGEHFDRVRQSLLSKAEEAGILRNPSAKGTARELLVSDFLRENLPGGFRFETGEIVNPMKERSGQVDVLIIPEPVPRFRIAGSVCLALAHGVAAAIEVKSTLTTCAPGERSELTNAMNTCLSVKRMRIEPALEPWPWSATAALGKAARLNNIPVSVIAFEGPTEETLRGHLLDWSRTVEKQHMPNTITCLSQGYTLTLNDGWRTVCAPSAEPAELYLSWRERGACLFDLFDHLMKVLQCWTHHHPATPLSRYQ